MSVPDDGVVLRPLSDLDELRACVALQEEVWGAGFSERVPVAILNAALRLGGVVAGAFDGDEMIGFVFGITGPEGKELAHWSDMLAVTPARRGRGVGLRLKRLQRELLLGRGVRTAYWTFDPLRSLNAYLNLARLGAVAREHHRDLYGSTGSPLHAGIGTDRLVVRWEMDGERASARLDRGEEPPGPGVLADAEPALGFARGSPHPVPGEPRLPDGPRWSLPVPRDLDPLLEDDPGLAAQWREATRFVLEGALARRMEVRELVPGADVSQYLIADREDTDSPADGEDTTSPADREDASPPADRGDTNPTADRGHAP